MSGDIVSRTKMALTPELVLRTLRPVPEEGPEPRWTPIPEDELDVLMQRVNEESKNEPLWIFAYGSLIWNPDFDFDAREFGTIYGWHRSFSLHMARCRAKRTLPSGTAASGQQTSAELGCNCHQTPAG
ncbi:MULTISPECIES: gamma-glutamylcyclotransferase [unclassified Rhizobium]|uniref:gamma-glutamylcyclotransferase n=1 Tax=unclassified Rhizobium TaxID=2613769 RepID=UPI001EF03026|nr:MULTISPECIES: gamma-glutamylcyclotransferase [unclassified Rhizobium]